MLNSCIGITVGFARRNGALSRTSSRIVHLHPVLAFHSNGVRGFNRLLTNGGTNSRIINITALSRSTPGCLLHNRGVSITVALGRIGRLILPRLAGTFLRRVNFRSRSRLLGTVHAHLSHRLRCRRRRDTQHRVARRLTIKTS